MENDKKQPLYFTVDDKGNIREYTEADKKEADERNMKNIAATRERQDSEEKQREKIAAMRRYMMSDKEPANNSYRSFYEEEKSQETTYEARKEEDNDEVKKEERIARATASSVVILLLIFHILPIILSLIAAFVDMDGGFYTFFKFFVIVEAVILIGIRLDAKKFLGPFDAIKITFISVMALVGILSFANGGFDREFWMVLDIIYGIVHILPLAGIK